MICIHTYRKNDFSPQLNIKQILNAFLLYMPNIKKILNKNKGNQIYIMYVQCIYVFDIFYLEQSLQYFRFL